MYVKPGKYVHFTGNKYEVIGTAKHSETLEEMVIYRALNGDGGLWVCPSAMWSDIVEHNECHVKRFTDIDEVVQETPKGIHKHSTSDEKVGLFLSLFAARDDVYAKRWENAKNGSAGYVPVCRNRGSSLCPKTCGGKMKCGECPNHNFIGYNADTVEKHLSGKLTAGVYPMFSDETCRFLAFDFDGKDYSPEDLRRDVAAIREACTEKGTTCIT